VKGAAIILARMDSARLPGKPLLPIRGRPLLSWLLERCAPLARQGIQIILATTDRQVDDPLVEYAASESLLVFRGATSDVAGRVLACAETFELSHFFRVNGDSPLMDPDLLCDAYSCLSNDSKLDFVTNIPGRSYPYGMSVEAFRTAGYRRGVDLMTKPSHREHVTAFFYENLSLFRWLPIHWSGPSLGSVRLTVDTPQDVSRMEELIDLAGPRWGQWAIREVAAAYEKITAGN
jgi:spore coat polysaccharide biosynthesis protein SpsF